MKVKGENRGDAGDDPRLCGLLFAHERELSAKITHVCRRCLREPSPPLPLSAEPHFPFLARSKHHAIHVQHTTAAGVFLGVAISLGSGAFPEGLLASCLALSAGATFHLASGTVLGPVLAIPADVGGPVQGLLEVAALAAGAAGVVAVGLAEGWAGIGH